MGIDNSNLGRMMSCCSALRSVVWGLRPSVSPARLTQRQPKTRFRPTSISQRRLTMGPDSAKDTAGWTYQEIQEDRRCNVRANKETSQIVRELSTKAVAKMNRRVDILKGCTAVSIFVCFHSIFSVTIIYRGRIASVTYGQLLTTK